MFRMMSSHALRAEPVYEGQVSEHVTLYLERGGGVIFTQQQLKKRDCIKFGKMEILSYL